LKEITNDEIRRLHDEEGLSFAEIARLLGCSRQNIWVRYYRGGKGRRKAKWIECPICGISFKPKPITGGGKTRFCSSKCYGEWLKRTFRRVKPNLKPTPSLSYILGVLLGDGSCFHSKHGRYVIKLGATKKEFAESFKKALEKIGLKPSLSIIKAKNVKNGILYRVLAFSKVFYEWFRTLSLRDIHNLLTKNEMKREFIRGFYESEGTRKWRKVHLIPYDRKSPWCRVPYGISFPNSNNEIIELVITILKELGFKPLRYFYKHQEKKDEHRVEINGRREVVAFFNMIKPIIKMYEVRVLE